MSAPHSVFQSRVKIFSDAADKASLLEMNANPRIAGMTTNPSLMRKAGVSHYGAFCKEVLKEIREKPISFEVFADDLPGMLSQAEEITTWGKNVYVKVPVLNTQGVSTAPIIERLSRQGVKLNVTAIYTYDQALSTTRALKGGAPSLVSVFAGRIADTGRDPMPLMHASREFCAAAGSQCELLWASTRELFNLIQAEQAGCQVITMPPDIIKKLSGLDRDLYQVSLDTVITFKKDSDAAGFHL